MAGEQLAVSLEEFGLSRYESQAYVALVTRGTISAAELAYYSDLPRTKVYPTLRKLEKKRLAVMSKGKPIMCTAVAPEDAFDSAIHEQINKVDAMNTLVLNLKKASEEGRRSRNSEERMYFHISANSVLGRLQSMIDGAKSSISIVADQWGLGLVAECRGQVVSAARRGTDIKVIIQPSQVCTEPFKSIPDGVRVRTSDIVQNCFIFDDAELLVLDSGNGRGATFSSTDILAANQARMFAGMWKGAARTDALADMTKSEAQEVYRIIRIIDENGLPHILRSAMITKKPDSDMARLLERNGVNIRHRPLDEVIDIADAIQQMTCAGRVIFEASTMSITVESKINGGHSLPCVSMLEGYLHRHGYKTRTAYQAQQHKGERVHIKIAKS